MYSKPANEFTTDVLADLLGKTMYKSPHQVDPYIKAGPFEEYCKEHGVNINKSAVFYVPDHSSGIGLSLLGDMPGDSHASHIIALGVVKCFWEKGNRMILSNQVLESQPKGEKLIVDTGKEDGLAGFFEKMGLEHSDATPEGEIQFIYTRN